MHFIEYIFHFTETYQPSRQIPPMFSQHTHKSWNPSHWKKDQQMILTPRQAQHISWYGQADLLLLKTDECVGWSLRKHHKHLADSDEVFWHLSFIICNVQPFHVQKENTSFLKLVDWGEKRSLKWQILITYHRLSKNTFQRKSSFPELKEILVANSADKVYLHHPFVNLYYLF